MTWGQGIPGDIGRLFLTRISNRGQDAFSTILPLIFTARDFRSAPILADPEIEYYRVFTVRLIQSKIES